jgi:hypothetical protein
VYPNRAGHARGLVLSQMTENRKVETRKPLIFRHGISSFGLKNATWTSGRIQTEKYGFKVFAVPFALLALQPHTPGNLR